MYIVEVNMIWLELLIGVGFFYVRFNMIVNIGGGDICIGVIFLFFKIFYFVVDFDRIN